MWLTTKDGRHFNTDWIDKEKQIANSKKEADSKNSEVGVGGLHKQPQTNTSGYTNSTGARRINSMLRQGQDTSSEQDVIDRLDANMEKTTRDMTVYREVNILDMVDRMVKVKPEANTFEALKKALIGQSFTDKGYYSSYYEKTNNKYENTVIETRVPKGTPAILTSNDKEKEVILGRNGSYKIIDVLKIDGGFKVIVERKLR